MKIKKLPSVEVLEECFSEDKGKLIWKERPDYHFNTQRGWKIFNTQFAGKPAGYLMENGYLAVRVTIDKVLHSFLVHRVLYKLYYHVDPLFVDHLDGDPLNNSMDNLKECTHHENMKNQKTPKSNTSGVKGVSWHKCTGKWRATVMHNKKQVYLGVFTDKEDAAAAVKVKYEELGFNKRHIGSVWK